MPYTPSATDPTQPTTSQTVESAALEFRTLKQGLLELAPRKVMSAAGTSLQSLAVTYALASATVSLGSLPISTLSGFSTSTNSFTVPATGVYSFDFSSDVYLSVVGDSYMASAISFGLSVNGSTTLYDNFFLDSSYQASQSHRFHAVRQLTAGDVVMVKVQGKAQYPSDSYELRLSYNPGTYGRTLNIVQLG